MAYKLIKPEIISVPKATIGELKNSWNRLRNNRYFWLFVCGGLFVIPSILIFSPAFLSVPILYILYLMNKTRSTFWKQVAEVNGWQYKKSSDPVHVFQSAIRSLLLRNSSDATVKIKIMSKQERNGSDFDIESGIMFKQGNGRMVNHYIDGVIEGRQFRIFNYTFGVGSGRSKKIYKYTVFAFRFDGRFPHIYLNNIHNSYSIKTGEQVKLPSEFEKQFILSAPRKYEIEALEIFTPDVLSKLLDMKLVHDIEFVEQEMIIFADGVVSDFEKLEKEFNMAIELENLLDKKLDRFKFEKIGDMSHNLK